MDYTTPNFVLQAMMSGETADDISNSQLGLIQRQITAVSRMIDHHCANYEIDNYFAKETFTDAQVNGVISCAGKLVCWPPKPNVVSVSALSVAKFRGGALAQVSVSNVFINRNVVETYNLSLTCVENPYVLLSYVGGMGEEAGEGELPSGLPADVVEAATVLAARFYKESSTGLADTIGIAETGERVYTKAWPVRVLEMLKPFVRTVPL